MSIIDKVKDKAKGFARNASKFKDKVSEKTGQQGPFKALEKDAALGRTLHSDVIAAMNILQEKQNIKDLLEKSYGYAVVPAVGRASAVLGGAYGVGEVFVKDHVIGYAAILKLDLGVQLGGTNFHEMIVFNDEETWKRFKGGKFSFAAEAGVAFVKGGAQASKGFGANTVVFVFNEGGMLLDLGIGLQKFIFKPTVLGRTRKAADLSEENENEGEHEHEHESENDED